MGFVILTTVEDVRYYSFKPQDAEAGVFSDAETEHLVKLLEQHKDVFTDVDTLARNIQKLRALKPDAYKETMPEQYLKILSGLDIPLKAIEWSQIIHLPYV